MPWAPVRPYACQGGACRPSIRVPHEVLHVLSFPVPTPVERLTAAFARLTDARYAVGILEACSADPVKASVEPVMDERGEVQLVMLHVDIDGLARERVLAAISGGHGVVVTPRAPEAADGDIARIA